MSFDEDAERAEGTREDVRVNVAETATHSLHQAVEVVTGDRPKPEA